MKWLFPASNRGLIWRFSFSAPFDPYALLQTWQADALEAGRFGATASFVGSMRDFNQNDTVRAMTLEHYPGMTEGQLESIVDDAKQNGHCSMH